MHSIAVGEPSIAGKQHLPRPEETPQLSSLDRLLPVTRFAVAVAISNKSSRQTTIAFTALSQLLPQQPQFILSDNGSEFMGAFDNHLQERDITHWWTYPRSPKMNAHNERFNRTIQEGFVAYHEEPLFSDLERFNHQLTKWLISYNTVIPHHGLNLQSPIPPFLNNARVPKIVDQYNILYIRLRLLYSSNVLTYLKGIDEHL